MSAQRKNPVDWAKRGEQDAKEKLPPTPPWPPLNGSEEGRERHHSAFCAYMDAYSAGTVEKTREELIAHNASGEGLTEHPDYWNDPDSSEGDKP